MLIYEGPGQGSALRERKLTFTHEWEKPNGAVLDAFLASHARPRRIVLFGMSMGGYFAPRAAAFDERIDGVVAFDVMYDAGATARGMAPGFVLWLQRNGLNAVSDALISLRMRTTPGFKWAVDNGMWTMGLSRPEALITAFDAYTLRDVSARIRADVLILAGAADHFVPVTQVDAFKAALTNARSVTTAVYERPSGGAEHCQLGAVTLWHATVFDWLASKYGPGLP